MEQRINLTVDFRSQKRPISKVAGVDYTYILAEIGKLIDEIRSDYKKNILKEYYAGYLYGEYFITYKNYVERFIRGEFSKAAIVNFRLTLDEIGSPSDLATFPDLKGIRFSIATIK